MGRPRKRPTLLEQLTSGADRRLFTRKSLDNHVIFEDELGDPLLEFPLKNVSLGGLYVEGDAPLRTGSKIFLSFTLSPGPAIRLVGEVARVEAEDGTAQAKGFGIRFIEVSSEIRDRLQAWLSHETTPQNASPLPNP